MPAIKDRNSGEVIEIVDTREMGWCVGGWWLVAKNGYEVASYDVDFPQSPNRRENARYEALPAETQSNTACSGRDITAPLMQTVRQILYKQNAGSVTHERL